MSTHQAAVLQGKGEQLTLQTLSTPDPGPHELLIAVHSIALNPIDVYMRDMGGFIKSYPFIPGSDIAGTVEAVGSSLGASSPFQPGTRVGAFAPVFFTGDSANGAFQARVLVPADNAFVLPDALSFTDAATLPMGVVTAWSGWTSIDLDYTTHFNPSDHAAVVVWGAASSVGVCAVQTAKALGFTVYATASPRHHVYIKSLGASECFDYTSTTAVEEIVNAAKSAGVVIKHGYLANGDPKPLTDVLAAFGPGAKLATAIPPNDTFPHHADVELKFVMAPEGKDDGGKRRGEHFAFVLQGWLAPRLEKGQFTPAPKARVCPGNLAGLNAALDVLKKGVSGEKLVVEI